MPFPHFSPPWPAQRPGQVPRAPRQAPCPYCPLLAVASASAVAVVAAVAAAVAVAVAAAVAVVVAVAVAAAVAVAVAAAAGVAVGDPCGRRRTSTWCRRYAVLGVRGPGRV